jgi:N-formylglutamate amidohydrolase
MKKLILHIPHSSTNIPLNDGYLATELSIQNEIVKLTDWYTDELFYSSNDTMIIAPFSRLFCDVERFENDADEVMAQYGMGAVYTHLDNGEILRDVPSSLRNKIMENYYWKHHNKFTDAVTKELETNGKCLIVDCHSYPSTPITRDLNQILLRPDFNIGIDPYHTSQKIIDASIAFFEEQGYSLGVDWPYSGTIVPMAFYQKNSNVNSIMLEINRKLYLQEPSNKKTDQFEEIQQLVNRYLEMLKKNS